MLAEAVGVGLCLLLWGTRAYLAAKYVVKSGIDGKDRRAWKGGTPDWIVRVMPWLEFLGWVALLASIAWWVLQPAPVLGTMGVRCVHDPAGLRFPIARLPFRLTRYSWRSTHLNCGTR